MINQYLFFSFLFGQKTYRTNLHTIYTKISTKITQSIGHRSHNLFLLLFCFWFRFMDKEPKFQIPSFWIAISYLSHSLVLWLFWLCKIPFRPIILKNPQFFSDPKFVNVFSIIPVYISIIFIVLVRHSFHLFNLLRMKNANIHWFIIWKLSYGCVYFFISLIMSTHSGQNSKI